MLDIGNINFKLTISLCPNSVTVKKILTTNSKFL